MTAYTPLSIRRLSTGSVFKLIFLGLMSAMLPLGLLMGLMAWMGFDTLHWQGVPVSGPWGPLVGLMVGLWVTLAFTAVLGCLVAGGLWLYARFRPLHLQVKIEQ